ncbi:hypothetical protein AAIR98_000027 [Elusimicrobium simillimum]|uniref:hypothetical protein n=1 Tax=Elusimicrobium simillimum TaxID=3143438 RepID=UPI003C6F0A0D
MAVVLPRTFVFSSLLPAFLMTLALASVGGYQISGKVYADITAAGKVIETKNIKPKEGAGLKFSKPALDLNFGSSLLGIAKIVEGSTSADNKEADDKKAAAAAQKDPIADFVSIYETQAIKKCVTLYGKTPFLPRLTGWLSTARKPRFLNTVLYCYSCLLIFTL